MNFDFEHAPSCLPVPFHRSSPQVSQMPVLDVSYSVADAPLPSSRIWTKSFRPATRRDWQKRFQRHLAAFRLGQAIAARDAADGIVPDLESYISTLRDSCGVKMLLDLVVYADGLTIPPQVFEHPTLRRLRQDAADIIAWATVRCHECAPLVC